MRSYFPKPYEGELVYSLVARYGRHVGIVGAETLGSVLFGSPRQRPAYDVPIRLEALASQIPAQLELSARRLVAQHTLFPYYAAFLAADEADAILSDIMADRGSSKVRLYLGSAIKVPKRLRFCPECCIEMERISGELYWRREHQIPWVILCPIHGCGLRSSEVVAGGRASSYVAATVKVCSGGETELPFGLTGEQLHDLRSLALDAVAVLLTGSTPLRDRNAWRESFRRRCAAKGLMLTSGHVNRSRLRHAIATRFGYLGAIWPDLMDLRGKENWIVKLNWTSDYKLNPVWAFVADQVLSGLQDNLDPLGPGPWPCRNDAAQHFGERLIDGRRRRVIEPHRSALFACACGWTYVSARRRESDGSVEAPTYVDYGVRLRDDIENSAREGLTILKTARRLDLPATTVWAAAEAHDIPGRDLWRVFMQRGDKDRSWKDITSN